MGIKYILDKREKDILNRLLYNQGYMTISALSEGLNISKRSIYYDICKINEWLEDNDIAPLEVERKKGILITLENKDKINLALNNKKEQTTHLFSPMERVSIIITTLAKNLEKLYIEDFMELCQVSRNTIISDLKVVANKLQDYDLSLTYENRKGYQIKGDSIKIRSLFFLYFNQLVNFYKSGVIELTNRKEIDEVYAKLKEIEKEMDTEYVSGVLFSLAVFIADIEKHQEQIKIYDIDQEQIINTKEYIEINKYFKDYSEDNKIYLALHLLGSRLQTVPLDMIIKEGDKEAYELARSLVGEFSRLACIDFKEVEEVQRALFTHLKTSIYRYRYGIQLGNPLLNDIKNQYPDLFELTKKACEYLEQQLGLPIPDGEIAYITLHFGGFINTNLITKRDKLTVLIVCPNGVSTGNMLRAEVQTLAPHADKIDVISLMRYHHNHNYSVVISTVYIENEKNLVIVHPILTDNDRVNILRKCIKNDNKQKLEITDIINLASKYIDESKLSYFKEDLENYYTSISVDNKFIKQNYGQGILHYLSDDHILIKEDDYDWEDAIRLSARPLLDDQIIDPNYINSIIEHNKNLGPYMFITDKVVLAHAKSEEGALDIGISLTIYHRPINFLGKEANIILVLSAIDQINHLKILKDIMLIFSNPKNITKIINTKSKEEILNLIKKYLEKKTKDIE